MCEKGQFLVKSATQIYKNPWIEVTEDKVTRPDGSDVIFGLLDMKDGVAILPVFPDGQVILSKEYKYDLSEKCSLFRTFLSFVRKLCYFSDMKNTPQISDLKSQIINRITSNSGEVWTPGDFVDLGNRSAIDKTLQRLVNGGELRRIERGLYDLPRKNVLTNQLTTPDYRAVIRAVARRDQARTVVDGMTAANDLGFTTAVPARIEVLIDARLKPIKLGNQEIHFKHAAPSRLYWAGRPAMRVVQSLYWMHDMLSEDTERQRIRASLLRLFNDPQRGKAIKEDLRLGLSTLPIWMQTFLRELLIPVDSNKIDT